MPPKRKSPAEPSASADAPSTTPFVDPFEQIKDMPGVEPETDFYSLGLNQEVAALQRSAASVEVHPTRQAVGAELRLHLSPGSTNYGMGLLKYELDDGRERQIGMVPRLIGANGDGTVLYVYGSTVGDRGAQPIELALATPRAAAMRAIVSTLPGWQACRDAATRNPAAAFGAIPPGCSAP